MALLTHQARANPQLTQHSDDWHKHNHDITISACPSILALARGWNTIPELFQFAALPDLFLARMEYVVKRYICILNCDY